MPTLNVSNSIVIYSDASATQNPKKRHTDWTRNSLGISVSNPVSRQYLVDPSGTITVFSGIRSTTLASNTEFTISLNSELSNTYRFTHTAGTDPTLRTDRGLTLTTSVVVTANEDETVEFAVSSGGDFGDVQIGDNLWLPSEASGDSASPFDEANCGLWSVIDKADDDLSIICQRLPGEDFSGITETVVTTAASQLQAFSSTGVQVGDSVDITAGFYSTAQKTFEVTAVTPDHFEVVSTTPLPLQAATPGAAGMVFYTDAKRFIRVETDQDAIVRLNGDTGTTVRISPMEPADDTQMSWFEKWGPCWSLVVVNRTALQMTVNVIAAD
jgi:hypothetical protein